MYVNNLKKLRNEYELTQNDIAKKIKCNRSTYNNWERCVVMIPLEVADKLSLFYNVRLSYILGIDENLKRNKLTKKMNYNILLKNLSKLKENNRNTFEEISDYLDCNRSTCQRYFKGDVKIPIDRLILLSKFYNVDLDELCGKE